MRKKELKIETIKKLPDKKPNIPTGYNKLWIVWFTLTNKKHQIRS